MFCLAVCADLENFHCHGKCNASLLFTKKKGSVTDPRFYHPIAVLPTTAMVFERVVYSQVYRHISPYIPPSQFGFMKGTGTQDCGNAMAFTAIQVLELRQECHIISLDIHGRCF